MKRTLKVAVTDRELACNQLGFTLEQVRKIMIMEKKIGGYKSNQSTDWKIKRSLTNARE